MLWRSKPVFSVFIKMNRLYNVMHFSSEDKIPIISALQRISGGGVTVILDITKKLRAFSEVKSNIKRRGLQIDVDKYAPVWSDIVKTEKEIEILNKEQQKKTNIFKTFSSQKKKDKKIKDKLALVQIEAKELSRKIKGIEVLHKQLIQEIITPTLSIPNDLHKMTEKDDKIISSFFKPPNLNFPVKSFVEIGQNNNEIELTNCSPTSYYLKNRLSILDLAFTEYFSSQFRNYGFVQHYNPDICRATLVEGCGINQHDKNEILALKNEEGIVENFRYLSGSGSLQSFVGWFANRAYKDTKSLPQRLVSVGRSYKPFGTSQSKLFTCTQTNMVGAFVAFPNQPDFEEMVFNEVMAILTSAYIKLGLHFKYVKYASFRLHQYETAAVGIQMFSPFHNDYFEVGRISLCGSYISRRLLSLYQIKQDHFIYLSMIHVQVADISNVIAFVLENKQTSDGLYDIPKCLEPLMFGFPCRYV